MEVNITHGPPNRKLIISLAADTLQVQTTFGSTQEYANNQNMDHGTWQDAAEEPESACEH